MKIKYYAPAELTRSQYVHMTSKAALAAMNALDNEGLYNEDASDWLWETAWNAAYNAIYCDDADPAESEYIATTAARRHALAIPGGMTRLKYIRAGKITPAWRIQLAQ